MRIDSHSWRPKSAGRIASLTTFSLTFALSAFGLAARAQTVGPITPHASAEPHQAPPESAAPEPDRDANRTLAGRWSLNRDQSDDPRQKLEQASSSGGGGGWGQGPSGGGGGWGGWGGGPWGGMGGGRSGNGGGWNRGGRPLPDEAAIDMSEFSQLTIEQSDSSAKVTGASGRVLAQTSANNDKKTQDAAKKSKDDPNTPPAAHWQGGELVTTVNGSRGMKTTQIYELAPNGTQLFVTTRLDNPRFNQPVSIRFVYDRGKSTTSN